MRVWHQSFTVLEDVPVYHAALKRHLESRALPGTEVTFHGMEPGTYPSSYPGTHIGYNYIASLHREQFVAAALEAQELGYDAFLIASIPDTGFEEIRSLVDMPVIGFGNTSIAFAATLAARVAIVNFIDALRDQLQRNIVNYGFGTIVGPILSIGREFGDLMAAYDNPAPVIDAFVHTARQAIAEGARVIVPGEGPLNVFLADQGLSRVDDVPVIDSLWTGLAMCEMRGRMYRTSNLFPARQGFYYAQPPIDVMGAARERYFGIPGSGRAGGD